MGAVSRSAREDASRQSCPARPRSYAAEQSGPNALEEPDHYAPLQHRDFTSLRFARPALRGAWPVGREYLPAQSGTPGLCPGTVSALVYLGETDEPLLAKGAEDVEKRKRVRSPDDRDHAALDRRTARPMGCTLAGVFERRWVAEARQ